MRPGPRRSIAQADIVAAAFEILEQSGFATVSIRGVAAALSLTPTAMYTYFPSKQDLLRAMVDELYAGVARPVGEADATGESLLMAAVELRERLRAHPGAVSLVTGDGVAGAGTIALIERLGQGFAAAGLTVDDAARAAHALLAHTIGHVALEQAWGEASADVADSTLWTDEPTRPIADAGDQLGLRSGADPEFRAATHRLITSWSTAE